MNKCSYIDTISQLQGEFTTEAQRTQRLHREYLIEVTTFSSLSDHIREVAPGLGKPPVTKNKNHQGDGREVGKAGPVGREAFEKDAAIAAHEGRKRIRVYVRTVAFRDD